MELFEYSTEGTNSSVWHSAVPLSTEDCCAFVTVSDHFREVGPSWISLPQYFKLHNYTTLATGKTYHPGLPPNWDQPLSWSTERPYVFAEDAYPLCSRTDSAGDSMVCPTEAADSTFADYIDAEATLKDMDYALSRSRPFFLVFGAHRPHVRPSFRAVLAMRGRDS